MFRKNKYNANMRNGRSKDERQRADDLRMLERAGVIQNLSEQVEYTLIPAQYDSKGKCIERSCKYKADFTYWKDGRFIVEDFKGVKTDDYIIKRKLMLERYGIRILETTKEDLIDFKKRR